MNIERIEYAAAERLLWLPNLRSSHIFEISVGRGSPSEALHRLKLRNAYAFRVTRDAVEEALVFLVSSKGNRNQGQIEIVPLRERTDFSATFAFAELAFRNQYGMKSFVAYASSRSPSAQERWLGAGFETVATIPWGDYADGKSVPMQLLYRDVADGERAHAK